MTKNRKNEYIKEMLTFGKAYLGTVEIRPEAVVKEYKAIFREVKKQFPEKVLCWDGAGSGEIWMM